MGLPLPGSNSGSLFGATGQFAQMPDGTLVNFAMAAKIQQQSKSIVLSFPNGIQDSYEYQTATLAAAALTGIADLLTAQSGILSLKSITPATAAAGATVNAVLLGTGFQYDLTAGVFGGQVTVGGNACTETYVNSNTILLSFTAPAAGTYDVVYTPSAGAAVTLTSAWIST
jgi:hypothetical protein